MAFYTQLIRDICENLAQMPEGAYPQVIEKARPLFFNFQYPFYDETKRTEFETNFLKHFYMREIGLETYPLFKLKLDDKLNTIMPYYNKLFAATSEEYAPYTDDYTTTTEHDNTLNQTSSTTNKDTINGTTNGTVVDKSKHIDTPQSSLENFEANKYITYADQRGSESNGTTSTVNDSTGSGTTDSTDKGTETRTEKGRRGYTVGRMMEEYINALQNITERIYQECEPLFMQLWGVEYD